MTSWIPKLASAAFALFLLGPGCASRVASHEAPWSDLFAQELRSSWAETEFGGGGEIRWSDDAVEFGFGSPLTGISWTGEFPRESFELRLRATRLEGNDFFCGLTFPVGEGHLTFIVGGWGGALTGLSSIDGQDASSNATTQFHGFKVNTPVEVLVRVGPARVEAFLDGTRVAAVERAQRVFSLRPEVLLSRPLGVASHSTRARIEALAVRF